MYNQSFTGTTQRNYYNLPIAIRIIISVNVAVYLLQVIGGMLGGQDFTRFVIQWFAYYPELFVTVTQPWRLVTYMFLHGGIWHILFNMLWLWWMGRAVEEALGPRTFCTIYFGAGIGGALFDLALAQFFGIVSVIGASGAVFGVMVAFAALYPNMPIMLFLLPPVRAKYVVAGLIGINVLFLGSGGGVARVVHLGGAAVGYLLIKWGQQGADLAKPARFLENWWYKIQNIYQRKKYATNNKHMYSVSDVEIIEETEESELDEILEKISKHGYDALTKKEKKKLFELSNKG